MAEALSAAITYIQERPYFRRHQRHVIVKPRHVWNMRDVEVVSPSWSRGLAGMAVHESGIVNRMAVVVRRNRRLWEEVLGQPVGKSTPEHVGNFVTWHLDGLVEKYFERRPTQRGVSRREIVALVADYSHLLASSTHAVSIVFPLTGLRGRLGQTAFADGVVLRHLRAIELQRLWAIQQDHDSWYSTSEVRDWDYCIAVAREIPRSKRPSVWIAWPEVQAAVTALRMATDGRIGMSIGWLVAAPPTILDTADRIVRTTGRIENAVPSDLSRGHVMQARSLYALLRGSSITGRLAIALRRYNFAVERDYLLDQLIDCWIGLETLYAPDMGTEINYRIRLRAARFLGQTATERDHLFQFLGRSYNVRSKIVHGDDPPDDLRELSQRTHQALRDSIIAWFDPNRDHAVTALDAALFTD